MMVIYKKCQVFTPQNIVSQLLDTIGYAENLFGKKIAETSCGDGNILVGIVDRYIKSALQSSIPLEKIKLGLESDIYGMEIDSVHITNCKLKLDSVAGLYGLIDVHWNILEVDFLKSNRIEEFDYVVSNPPYIKYSDLPLAERSFVKNNFETCSVGKFDYCYAFVEASLKALKKNGELAYLIPSNIFKNQFARKLRDFILPHLTDIYDFTTQKLFEGKLTASSFIICKKGVNSSKLVYHDLKNGIESSIKKTNLTEKWVFQEYKKDNVNLARFGDYFHAASSIATLLNEAYILSTFRESENSIIVDEIPIEKSVVRRAISPRSVNMNIQEYVIFPYYFENNSLKRYSEVDFDTSFPGAVQYLQNFKDKLSKRTSDKGTKWFEYGRSQAIAHQNQEKLLMSTLVTGKVKLTHCDVSVIPTSGIYIVLQNNELGYTLTHASHILLTKEFFDYVRGIGIVSGGNSYRITAKDINNFTFPKSLLSVNTGVLDGKSSV